MSIRLIAKDLYRYQQEVERLEKALEETSIERRDELRERIRKIKAERNRLRRMLDGAKASPEYQG